MSDDALAVEFHRNDVDNVWSGSSRSSHSDLVTEAKGQLMQAASEATAPLRTIRRNSPTESRQAYRAFISQIFPCLLASICRAEA